MLERLFQDAPRHFNPIFPELHVQEVDNAINGFFDGIGDECSFFSDPAPALR